MEFFPGERSLGGENSDGAGLGVGCCRFDTRFHSNKRNGVGGTESFDSGDGGRVAGDDDELAALVDEEVRDGEDATLDLISIAGTVRAPGAVTKIDKRLIGQNPVNLVEHRKSPES